MKLSDKLSKVSDSLTLNMYDNGFMVEVSGKDLNDDWSTAKIMASSKEEVVAIIDEAVSMERDD
jgi:hypothetical protein|tara:strand:- start:363 stop:554 length:192 start_codon:yes stop_codon:yes gene_type:complete